MSDIKYTNDYHLIKENKIHYKYFENGSPTVIFEAGLGDDSSTWKKIQDDLSLITSTLAYDRVGTGKSKGRYNTRAGLDIVQDLQLLINKLTLDPPFLLVGHSFGGLISRLFASVNRDDIVGMILIDSACENKELDFIKVLDDKQRVKMKNYLKNPNLNSEKIDKIKTYRQILKYKEQFDFPLTIIIRGLAKCYGSDWPEKKLLKVERKLQSDLKNIAKKSKIVVAQKSGHYIQNDEPELVIKEINKMITNIYI